MKVQKTALLAVRNKQELKIMDDIKALALKLNFNVEYVSEGARFYLWARKQNIKLAIIDINKIIENNLFFLIEKEPQILETLKLVRGTFLNYLEASNKNSIDYMITFINYLNRDLNISYKWGSV